MLRKFYHSFLIALVGLSVFNQSLGATFTVTNTNAVGAGSLNAAITSANATLGADLIVFAIGTGAQTIGLVGNALPNITETVTIDGFSQPGWTNAPIITISYNDYVNTFILNNAPGSLIRGFIMTNNGNPIVSVTNSASTTIAGIYFKNNGTAATGGQAGYAISLTNSPNSLIGGNASITGYRNVISNVQGIAVQVNAGSGGTRIINNYFGLNAAGTAAINNGNNHVEIAAGSNGVVIGGTNTGDPNIFGGSGGGNGALHIYSNNCSVLGNYFGLMANGTTAVAYGGGNADAVRLNGADNSLVRSNVIANAGNNGNGVYLLNSATANFIEFNFIGTDVTGNAAVPNGKNGVWMENSGNNRVTNNVIARNGQNGVYISSSTANTTNSNYVGANYIGVFLSGNASAPNGTGTNYHGVHIDGTPTVTINNTTITGNIICSSNSGCGVRLNYGGSDLISNNTIGLGADGNTPIGIGAVAGATINNNVAGIWINNGTPDVRILNNTIACVNGYGIAVNSSASASNNYVIQGNKLGTNSSGLVSLGVNRYSLMKHGIFLNSSQSNYLIGGNSAGVQNIISNAGRPLVTSTAATPNCTGQDGVGIFVNAGFSNLTVAGNYIGVDATGIGKIGNMNQGLYIQGGTTNLYLGLTGTNGRNVWGDNAVSCSGGGYGGYTNSKENIQIRDNATNVFVVNNYIGIGADGVSPVPNGKSGISFNGSGGTNRIIGGFTAAERNVVSANQNGISINQNAAAVLVVGNYVGTDANGNVVTGLGNKGYASQANSGYGIGIVDGTSNSTVTSNLIAGNLQGIRFGIDEPGSGTNSNNNIVCSNTIIQNTNGIVILGGSQNNQIGNAAGTCSNTIQNNSVHGILFPSSPGNATQNPIRRNSISCNGLTQPLVGGVRSIYGINLNLSNGNNANISITPAFVYPPYILSTGGINYPNTPTPQSTGPAPATSDVIEVFYDPCGTCQGQTYLGNATVSVVGSTLYWTFPAGSIPNGAFCSTTIPAGTCPSGIINISATRTNTNGNTSQFMPCSGVQVLPVTFIAISAEKKGASQANISWTVAQIANANYYIIEKSMNGVDFEAKGSKKGVTNSALAIQFEFLDSDLWHGTTYYRVVQVDLDGSKHPSDIVALQNNGVEISVFPVPSTGLVHIWTSASMARQAEYQLVNVLGKEFLSGKFKLTEGFAKEELDLSGYPSGSYVLKVWINGELTIHPIIKQD